MKETILFLKARTGMDDPSPPMAFGYLGDIAKKKGFNVIVENLNAQYNQSNFKDIVKLIKKENPLFVGVHMFTNAARDTYSLIKEIRPYCKLIIAGGPHPTACPEELLERGVDIAVIGEAEISFGNLLDAIINQKDLEKVKGIAFKKKGNIIITPLEQIIHDLDQIPIPDRDVHRKSDYVKIKDEINNFGQILSTRGCPGRCTYCFSVFNKQYRYQSAKRVFEEIFYLHKKYNITFVNFIDDAITINKPRLVDLCNLLIAAKLPVGWSCSTRIDFLDKDLITLMKKAGCNMITVGIETYIPETLLKMKKTSNTEGYIQQADNVLKWCYEENIRCGVNILTGFPWETANHIKEMQKHIQKIKHYVTQGFYGGVLQPQPGTEMYEKYAKEYNFEKWWLYRKPLFNDDYRPFFMAYYHQYWDHLHNNFLISDKKAFKEIDKLYRLMGRWNLYMVTKRRFKNKFIVNSLYSGLYLTSLFSMGLFYLSPFLERNTLGRIKKLGYKFKFRNIKNNLAFS